MTHWINPWEDAVPVPIEELVLCCANLNQWSAVTGGGRILLTAEKILEHWRSAGDKLDAYILPGPPQGLCMGIRYGSGGSEYLSPFGNQSKLAALLANYT